MRSGYCIGGPLDNRRMSVMHGARLIHAPTGARYEWVAESGTDQAHWRYADCRHYSYTSDSVSGECKCDDCGKLLIDSIGRVLEELEESMSDAPAVEQRCA